MAIDDKKPLARDRGLKRWSSKLKFLKEWKGPLWKHLRTYHPDDAGCRMKFNEVGVDLLEKLERGWSRDQVSRYMRDKYLPSAKFSESPDVAPERSRELDGVSGRDEREEAEAVRRQRESFTRLLGLAPRVSASAGRVGQWVFDNLPLPVSEIDSEGVPSVGALGLLRWAKHPENQSSFYLQIYPKMLPPRSQMGSEEQSAKELEVELNELRKAGANGSSE